VKIKELRSLSKEELLQKQKSLKEQLFKLNMQRYGGRVEKPHMFFAIRKEIARIHTLLNERPGFQSFNEKNISNGSNKKKE
jgi:large subunit ribosomal protein L29